MVYPPIPDGERRHHHQNDPPNPAAQKRNKRKREKRAEAKGILPADMEEKLEYRHDFTPTEDRFISLAVPVTGKDWITLQHLMKVRFGWQISGFYRKKQQIQARA